MKAAILTILLIFGLGQELGSLSLAQEAFEEQAYSESARFYRQALREYPEIADHIAFNLAQCLVEMDSFKQAGEYYQLAMKPDSPGLASKSANNLGVLLVDQAEMRRAVDAFRLALVYDSENEIARRNFEKLKRRLEKKPEEQDDQPSDFQSQEPEDLPEPDDSQAGETPPSLPVGEYRDLIEQLRKRRTNWKGGNDMPSPQSLDTISLELARSLLEDMRQEDMQFLQQLRKSPAKSVKRDNKPDW
ncbi:MAG: tetratricopeptide repeat protein [Bacteroidota bacterium]